MIKFRFAKILLLVLSIVFIAVAGVLVNYWIKLSNPEPSTAQMDSCGTIVTTQKVPNKDRLKCFDKALKSCFHMDINITTPNEKDGVSTNTYTVYTSNNTCIYKITTEIEAPYLPYGYSKFERECQRFEVDTDTVNSFGCSNPTNIYNFCDYPNDKQKDLCVLNEALTKKDASICEKTSFKWGKDHCKEEVLKIISN